MGFSFSKDKNIDLYITTDKQYYLAGEQVDGEIYLNAKAYSLYNRLVLKLLGQQYVFWEESSGQGSQQSRTIHENKHKNYEHAVLIYNFNGEVKQGQYVFPFTLHLPTMITGSFYYSSSCYLKYNLRVELEHPTNQSDSQYYQMFLNLIEPPRTRPGPVSVTNRVNSKCCRSCCIDYGITSITLKSDKNFVLNGDQIRVAGTVDNSKGNENIKRCTIMLQQRRFMAAGQVVTQDMLDNSYQLAAINETIYKNTTKNFQFSCQIPASITSYTAIGKIVSCYFVLHMYTQYGCCANSAQASIHLIVHSRTPKIVEKKILAAPANWNPRRMPHVSCNTMKPFMYTSIKSMPYLNLPYNEQVIMNVNNGSNYFPQQNQVYPNMNYEYMPENDRNNNYHQYQPIYYNQGIFSDIERQQQGYQPYFNQNP